jgi:LPXTG-motif cell wall-anchored protein
MTKKSGLTEQELSQRAGEFEQIGNNYLGRNAFSMAMREFSQAARDYYASRNFDKAAEMYDMAAQSRRKLPHSIEKVYKKETLLTAGEYEKMRDSMRQMGEERRNESLLEGSMSSASLAIAGILAGIFFLSPNITGNAIANMTNSTTNFIGAGLLLVGLAAGVFWVKTRKK